MGYRPLAEFSPEEQERLTGKNWGLPTAKWASEPYVYDGQGGPPVPHGTKISTWFGSSSWGGAQYWVASKSSPKTWSTSCVFRIREQPPEAAKPSGERAKEPLERIAEALERIADHLAMRERL